MAVTEERDTWDRVMATAREMATWGEKKLEFVDQLAAQSQEQGIIPDLLALGRWYDEESARREAKEDAKLRASLRASGAWLRGSRENSKPEVNA